MLEQITGLYGLIISGKKLFTDSGLNGDFLVDILTVQKLEDYDYFLPAIFVSYKIERNAIEFRTCCVLTLHIVVPKVIESITISATTGLCDLSSLRRRLLYPLLLKSLLSGSELPGTTPLVFRSETCGYVRNRIKEFDIYGTDFFTQTYELEFLDVGVNLYGIGEWYVEMDNVVG
jgi:hypothetical protein